MRDITFLRNNLKSLLRQLYPTGRAWKNPIGSDGDKVLTVKSNALARHLYDVEEFVSTILPDNDLFNASNATNWERRLGLDYDVTTLTLEERKAEILRKLSYPGGFKNTLTLEFLEYQLRASLFDVRVYRNPSLSQPAGTELIANSVEKEEGFSVTNFNYSFIIAGDTVDTQAIIDSRRRNEFMRKILRYKPMHMVCFLLSNISKQDGSFQLKYSDYLCELIKETPPYATNVTMSGIEQVGKTLTGSYTYNDDEGDAESGTTFKWYRSDDNTGTNRIEIAGATGETYTLTSDDANKYIQFAVIPANVKASGDEVLSGFTGAIEPEIKPVITSFIGSNVNVLSWDMADDSENSGTWQVEYSFDNVNWNVRYGLGSPRGNVLPIGEYDQTVYFRVKRISTPVTEYSEVFSVFVKQVVKLYGYTPAQITNGDIYYPPEGICFTNNEYTQANVFGETPSPEGNTQLWFLWLNRYYKATKENIDSYPTAFNGRITHGIGYARFSSISDAIWEVDRQTGVLKYISNWTCPL